MNLVSINLSTKQGHGTPRAKGSSGDVRWVINPKGGTNGSYRRVKGQGDEGRGDMVPCVSIVEGVQWSVRWDIELMAVLHSASDSLNWAEGWCARAAKSNKFPLNSILLRGELQGHKVMAWSSALENEVDIADVEGGGFG